MRWKRIIGVKAQCWSTDKCNHENNDQYGWGVRQIAVKQHLSDKIVH